MKHKIKFSTILAFIATVNAYANNSDIDHDQKIMDRIMVIGSKENINNIPGSAHFIDEQQLDNHNYRDVNSVLKQMPGINIVNEEGFGTRPNIGFRGGRTDRTSDITLMEDGILAAPAPYAAPSAYYFPRISRMSGVEVRKGSSTTEFGPRTTSGALNLLSSPTPEQLEFEAMAGYGNFNSHFQRIHHGNKINNFSYVFDVTNDQSDGFKDIDIVGGDTGYSIQDIMAKFKYETDDNAKIYQSIELKLGYTQEDSDETYLGLTDADFRNDPYRRYAASQLDNMDADHQTYQLRHFVDFNDFDLTTTIYRNDFARNWYKLRDNVTNNDDQTGLELRTNNREYYSQGIQSVLGSDFKIANFDHKLKFSARLHQDEEDRFQRDDTYDLTNGIMNLTAVGGDGAAGNREAKAVAAAFYVSDAITYDKFTLTPGLRYENIRLERRDRNNSSNNAINQIDVLIPSLGSLYKFNDNVATFASIHKGFSPPSPGSTSTKEEESVNYEAGFRYNKDSFNTELTAFFNDYSNLNGECTASSGGGCNIGDEFNAGAVEVTGFEFATSYDLAATFESNFQIPVTFNYTFTDSKFKSNFESSFDEWGSVNIGDQLPYLAKHQYFLSVGFIKPKWEVNVNGRYTSTMRSVAGQGDISSDQKIGRNFIVDLATEYEIANKTRLFFNVENLFDEQYIASRRPMGARPGKPLSLMAGFKYKF